MEGLADAFNAEPCPCVKVGSLDYLHAASTIGSNRGDTASNFS